MKKIFSWANFSKEFLAAVITSNNTPDQLRNFDVSRSKIALCARMDRIANRPDLYFVKTYRKEIETFILCDTEKTKRICKFLSDKNIAGISADNDDAMKKSLFDMPMNHTLSKMYIDELEQIGMSTDDSKEKLYYSDPKNIDLTCVIPSDISLEDYQQEAVAHLTEFYNLNNRGILVMPTGSGKTRTAVYYLLRQMISQGYQVLWLAHRSLLLEQTANTFIKNASVLKLSDNSRESMKLICVSGEHCRITRADNSYDVIIGSVQSLADKLDVFPFILRDKLITVVDEAHHTVAPTYRRIIDKVFETVKNVKLLGLTATPVRLSEKESFSLMKLYNDNIIFNISMGELSAKQVLSEPDWERIPTDFDIEAHINIDEAAYIRKWGELSPKLVDFLAGVCERNDLIVNTYLNNKERYGKTIVFAMNAHHCMSLCDLFIKKGIRCDYVYSGNEENNNVIRRFRNGEIDVLVNINILTEGSDIPDIQTVFITRPTQSDVLLMQMIGRGMRGKAFGGTEKVNIVDFCDKWESFNKWLNPQFVFGGTLSFEEHEYKQYQIKKYPWQMFKDIINGISYTYGEGTESRFVSVPVGWYDAEINEHKTKIIVFEDQLTGYEKIMEDYKNVSILSYSDIINRYFRTFCLLPSENDIFILLSEIKRTGKPLPFHSFKERSEVDAVYIADKLKKDGATPLKIENTINAMYSAHSEIIDSIYEGKEMFRERVFSRVISDYSLPVIGSAIKEFPAETLPYKYEPVYDIIQLRDEVIEEMFKKKKLKDIFIFSSENIPKIEWTDKPYTSYFGIYYSGQNLIRINSLLNSASVPRETVKFIVYHELIHTQFFYHTKEFYAIEHMYPNFAAHNHFLDDTFGKFDFSSYYNDVM